MLPFDTIKAANMSFTLQVRVSVAALATMWALPVAVVPWWTTQGKASHWSNSILEMSTLLPTHSTGCPHSFALILSNSPQSMISMSPLFLRSIVKAEAEATKIARLRKVFILQ